MECPHCQREMITGASVCHHCGKRPPMTLIEWLSRLGMVLLLLAALALAAVVVLRVLAAAGL